MGAGSIANKLLGSFGYRIAKIPVAQNVDPLDIYLRNFSPDSVEQRRFYNVGAGKFSHPAWTNIDLHSDHYSEIQKAGYINFDLLSLAEIPVESGVAEVVYTSHTVEHVTDAAVQNLFNESYRMLKPGGFFRATTPNIDLEFEAYQKNDRDFFYWKKPSPVSIGQIFLNHFASMLTIRHPGDSKVRLTDDDLQRIFAEMPFAEAMNYITSLCDIEIQKQYPGNHINWWNAEKMVAMLKAAGFENVYVSAFGQSKCPALRDTSLFDSRHPRISLYVEAIK